MRLEADRSSDIAEIAGLVDPAIIDQDLTSTDQSPGLLPVLNEILPEQQFVKADFHVPVS
jgi:hypothetical protein